MSDNKDIITSKKCRGVLIPRYKRQQYTKLNPSWGKPDKPDEPEFVVTDVLFEVMPVCADCKKVTCD